MRWAPSVCALLAASVLGAGLGASARAQAQEPAPGDDAAADAVGFGQSEVAPAGEVSTEATAEPSVERIAREAPPEPTEGVLTASGSLGQRAALWVERLSGRPLAQARSSADLALRYKKPLGRGAYAPRLRLLAEGHLEYDLAYLQPHLRDDEPTRQAYEVQLIGRESYASLAWDALELTFGRQIVPFGQGELLSPIDVVNPRDQREPGLAELDDLRMAVLASRAGLYVDAHRLELLVVHESYFGLRPAPLSDYSPLRALLTDDPRAAALLEGRELRYVDLPGRFTEGAGQLYARWSYAGEGLDLALYAASTLDKQGVPTLPGASALREESLSLYLWHPRYTMLAHSGAAAVGAFILRWEASVDLDRPLAVRDDRGDTLALAFTQRDVASALLACSYFGVEDTSVALEYAQSLALGGVGLAPGTRLLGPLQAPAFGLRVTRTFLREMLSVQLVALLLGLDPYIGSFARLELDYELEPALHLTAGYALYLPSADELGPFYGFTTHDRVYTGLRWDFALD